MNSMMLKISVHKPACEDPLKKRVKGIFFFSGKVIHKYLASAFLGIMPSVVTFPFPGLFFSPAENIRPQKGKGSNMIELRKRGLGASRTYCVGCKSLISHTCRAGPNHTEASDLEN